jgi:hypothetical protein
MAGAAGQTGGHQALATGGSYSLNGGFVPIAVEGEPQPPTGIFQWLPFILNGE